MKALITIRIAWPHKMTLIPSHIVCMKHLQNVNNFLLCKLQ